MVDACRSRAVVLKDVIVVGQSAVAGSPKLLSIGLHDRLIGRPGRAGGLIKLLQHMKGFDGIWFCRCIDIAQHWRAHFPPDS